MRRAASRSGKPEEIAAGDAFVLCSDGLTELVGDAEILQAVEAGGAQAACDALLALTLARGAHDNVTVVVVRCRAGRRRCVRSRRS